MLVDSYCVPTLTNKIQAIVNTDITLIKLNSSQAYAIDTVNIFPLLPSLLAEQGKSLQEMVVRSEHVDVVPTELSAQVEELSSPTLLLLAQNVLEQLPLFKKMNLLQGAYAPKRIRKHPSHTTPLMRWKKVAAVVAILIGVQLIGMFAEGLYVAHKTTLVNKEIETYYRQLFPQDSHIVNVKSQLISHLKTVEGGNHNASFLNLLTVVSTTIQKHNLQNSFQVNQLTYLSDKAELSIEFMVNNFEQLNQFKLWLNQEGINADIGSVTSENNKTKATLRAWQS
jgi:type II secretion system protein L